MSGQQSWGLSDVVGAIPLCGCVRGQPVRRGTIAAHRVDGPDAVAVAGGPSDCNRAVDDAAACKMASSAIFSKRARVGLCSF